MTTEERIAEIEQTVERIEAKIDALAEPLAMLRGIVESIKDSPYAGMLGVQ